jgi:hypothetical protein
MIKMVVSMAARLASLSKKADNLQSNIAPIKAKNNGRKITLELTCSIFNNQSSSIG